TLLATARGPGTRTTPHGGASTLLAIARGPGTRTTPHPGALLATAGLADRPLRALPGACARARPQLDAVRPRREHPREEHGPGHGAQLDLGGPAVGCPRARDHESVWLLGPQPQVLLDRRCDARIGEEHLAVIPRSRRLAAVVGLEVQLVGGRDGQRVRERREPFALEVHRRRRGHDRHEQQADQGEAQREQHHLTVVALCPGRSPHGAGRAHPTPPYWSTAAT